MKNFWLDRKSPIFVDFGDIPACISCVAPEQTAIYTCSVTGSFYHISRTGEQIAESFDIAEIQPVKQVFVC